MRFKAFPENVTRFNAMFHIWKKKIDLSLNALRFYKWYSPIGTEADPGLIINAGLNFKPTDKWHFTFVGKNLTNENALYPMNSNAGGQDVSPGTPGLESITFWTGVRYKL